VANCPHYDGSVMAIFPKKSAADVQALAFALNRVDWEDLGFICDGRFLFTQRSLEQTPLPGIFRSFLPEGGKSWWKKLKTLI
jgi:adenine-specific DNA-methyltransferase